MPAAALPPALPSCILRGHASHIHCVQFVRHNAYLLTADAQGCVVYWSVATKRAVYVWKAHAAPVLGIAQWGHDRIITHGRDNSLRVWQLRPDGRPPDKILLPADSPGEGQGQGQDQPLPWLLHSLPVNTLNFCAFSMCHQHAKPAMPQSGPDSILVAVPGRDDKQIEVWQLPDEKLKILVPRVQTVETGMVMAVQLIRHQRSQTLLLLAGYEGGVTAAFTLPGDCTGPAVGSAQLIYLSQPHSQPVLSLDASPDGDFYFTSSADAKLAMHRVPQVAHYPNEHDESNFSTTMSAASAGQTLRAADVPQPADFEAPPAFAKQSIKSVSQDTPKPGGLASLLASSSTPLPRIKPASPVQAVVAVEAPHKIVDTKHAGQQSLRVRSDGRLIITGGWDTRIRIYSTRTLKEVAVLKWHKEGVYAVAFAEILTPEDVATQDATQDRRVQGRGQEREDETRRKHWVAAGAKDGKVSLWEVF